MMISYLTRATHGYFGTYSSYNMKSRIVVVVSLKRNDSINWSAAIRFDVTDNFDMIHGENF